MPGILTRLRRSVSRLAGRCTCCRSSAVDVIHSVSRRSIPQAFESRPDTVVKERVEDFVVESDSEEVLTHRKVQKPAVYSRNSRDRASNTTVKSYHHRCYDKVDFVPPNAVPDREEDEKASQPSVVHSSATVVPCMKKLAFYSIEQQSYGVPQSSNAPVAKSPEPEFVSEPDEETESDNDGDIQDEDAPEPQPESQSGPLPEPQFETQSEPQFEPQKQLRDTIKLDNDDDVETDNDDDVETDNDDDVETDNDDDVETESDYDGDAEDEVAPEPQPKAEKQLEAVTVDQDEEEETPRQAPVLLYKKMLEYRPLTNKEKDNLLPLFHIVGFRNQYNINSNFIGTQCTVISLVAVVYHEILHMAFWNYNTLDYLVLTGNFYHQVFREAMTISNNPDGRIALDELPAYVTLHFEDPAHPGREYQFLTHLGENSGVLVLHNTNTLDDLCRPFLEEYLTENLVNVVETSLVITIGEFSHGIVKTKEGYIFLFDSHGFLTVNEPVFKFPGPEQTGGASLTQYEDLRSLLYTLRSNHTEVDTVCEARQIIIIPDTHRHYGD